MLAASLAAFALVLGRAAYLQAFESGRLDSVAQQQQQVSRVLQASRGAIVDRTGNTLALSQQAMTVGANTRLVQDPASLATALAPILGVSGKRLQDQLDRRGVEHVDLARQVDPATVRQLQRRKLGGPGVLTFIPDQQRVYPDGSLGSQVVGFANIDEKGIAGVEYEYDRYLRAQPGREVDRVDSSQRVLKVLSRTNPRPGHNVVLTLDGDLQATTERVVAETQAHFRAKWATAIVIDPRTGGVLAMASAPGVPAGGYSSASLNEQRIRAISDQYEPGSTFKAVTMGTALELGKVTPQTVMPIPKQLCRYDKCITDAEKGLPPELNVNGILANSSNIGTVEVAEQYLSSPGPHPPAQRYGDLLNQSIERLGFGKLTGIDLPGEAPGSVLPFDQWSGTTILNVPIGEGVAVTPLQMAAFYAGIADHGVWHQPHLLDHVQGERAPRWKSRRLLSGATTQALVGMLESVVDSGTGSDAQLPGYTVAGKTGTTQKVDPVNHKYCGWPGGACRYDASFVGFLPAAHPRAVVLVVVDEPDTAIGYYGRQVAIPAFRQIATTAMASLDVPLDHAVTPTIP
jgi:cell division protein FtsI/penicillin-binding protein 2